jgi:hypothetical protein
VAYVYITGTSCGLRLSSITLRLTVRIYLTTNSCTIELTYHLELPYICFGRYMTIIGGIDIFMFSLNCALSTVLLFSVVCCLDSAQ